MFFLPSGVDAMLEVVCFSDVSEEVTICTCVFEISRVMMQTVKLSRIRSVSWDRRRTWGPQPTGVDRPWSRFGDINNNISKTGELLPSK
jgi:hypothetical protein